MSTRFTSISSASKFTFRFQKTYVPLAFLFIVFCFVFTPLPVRYHANEKAIIKHISDTAQDRLTILSSSKAKAGVIEKTSPHETKSRYAFATFLAGSDSEIDSTEDNYFIATRILTYQLLHAPETKSKDTSTPFIVLVTDRVPEWQRIRLRRDGATVIHAPYLNASWINAAIPGWDQVLTKLRLWELTEFERICFLDADTQLTAPLDGVFVDQAVATQVTNTSSTNIQADEASLPSTFVFAGVPEMKQVHHYPPAANGSDFPNPNYLNAGFFVFAPDVKMLEYYKSIMRIPDRFDSSMPEQNLLNYAHRREEGDDHHGGGGGGGAMPWQTLANTWNIHYPTMDDVRGGVVAIHEKWWAAPNGDLGVWMRGWRWRMEGFYEGRDLKV